MTWDPDHFEGELNTAVNAFDRARTERLCERLIERLRTNTELYESGAAGKVLGHLQRQRYFNLLQRVADVFLQTGVQAPRIRQHYAQALLDQGALCAAISFLDNLVQQTADRQEHAVEHSEARGLLGRAYKQIYVDFDNPESAEARRALNQSINWYHSAYVSDPTEHSWHGINAVATLRRAAVDGVPVQATIDTAARSMTIAQEILDLLTAKWSNGQATTWDSGTAMEACIALSKTTEASGWLSRYVSEPHLEAFHLASTLRQLEEVWRLDLDSDPGSSLLPLLKAELLNRQGGSLDIQPQHLNSNALKGSHAENFEKTFGKVRYVNYKFMLKGIDRARAVARIEYQPGQGFGTGFIIRGGDLHEPFGDELMLLTNAHVVSEDPAVRGALRPDDAIVTFQLLKEETRDDDEYSVAQIVWSSPPWELDASLLRLEENPAGLEPYPLAPRLPLADGEQRVYVIGHPKGGSLSFSIQDNVLLDHQAPLLHYRAPTEGGSSGSPVFNSQWKLIGLHHAGGTEMARLNQKEGTYEANEGVWIQSVAEAIKIES